MMKINEKKDQLMSFQLSDEEKRMLGEMAKQLDITAEEVLQKAVVFFCNRGVKHPEAQVGAQG